MNSSAMIGDRIRVLRLASDLSQVQLAERLHLDGNSQVSKLENGRIAADPHLLSRLADALDCSPELLVAQPFDIISTRPWLRAYADAPARALESLTADNCLSYEVAKRLALKWVPERIPRFDGDVNDPHAIEEFAIEVRLAADVAGGAPVGNAIRAAERLGCVVLPLSDELGRHLGFSQYVDGQPYIRVSKGRQNVPGDRQRFTVAHELGHLGLHAGVRPPETADEARRIESQAHRFAGAFLAPRDALLEDLESSSTRITLSRLAELKANWGVAVKMLVVRLRQLGVIGEDQATSLYKQISKRGWNSGEPVPVSHERAIWLDRALAQKWPAVDPVYVLRSQGGLGASHATRWLSWETTSVAGGTVVPLQPPASRGQSGAATPSNSGEARRRAVSGERTTLAGVTPIRRRTPGPHSH